MISDEQGHSLHHRAALGEPLTQQERESLEEWYAFYDAQEAAMFALNATAPVVGVEAIKAQNEVMLAHLVKLTQHNQQISLEIEKLERENARLRHQLALRFKQQAA